MKDMPLALTKHIHEVSKKRADPTTASLSYNFI